MRTPVRAVRAVFRPHRARDPEGRMTLVEHLDELRYRLVWSAVVVAVAGVAGWALFNRVIEILLVPAAPYLREGLIFTAPTEAFVLRFKVATYVGVAISSPVLLFHFWRFVAPGLRPQEKRYVVPFVFFGVLLFAAGTWFAYATLPQALKFLIGPAISGPHIRPLLTGEKFVGFMLMYLLAFGLSFEFPLVLMMLSLTRVVSSSQMAKYRRHVFMGIAVVVAVATPSVDFYTMLVLTAALYILFEGCIWLSRALKR